MLSFLVKAANIEKIFPSKHQEYKVLLSCTHETVLQKLVPTPRIYGK